MESPEASGMKVGGDESERRDRQQVLEYDRENRDECLELFRARVGIRLAAELLQSSTKISDGAGDVE